MAVAEKFRPVRKRGFSPKRKSRPGFRLDGRTVWFAAVLIVFSLSTFLAFTQKPRRNAYAAVTTFTLDWWQHPIERNAMLRLPIITGGLNGVFALPGTDKVWVVGKGGLILHSTNGGRTWEQQTLQPGLLQQQEDPQQTAQQSAFYNLLSPGAAVAEEKGGNGPPVITNPNADQSLTISAGPFTRDLNATPAVFTDPDKDSLSYTADSNYPKIANVTINGSVLRVAAITAGEATITVSASDGKKGSINMQFAVKVSGSPAPAQEVEVPAQVVEAPADTAGTFKADLRAIYFVNPSNGWAVGGRDILNTTDGGKTWQNQNSGTSSYLYSVTFTDPNNGWAVGTSILNTTNGGKNWQIQRSATSSTFNNLSSVTFIDPHNGWAVGDLGTILNTADGGKTWQKQNSRILKVLFFITFIDPDNGWAVGDGGTILNTTDGGKTWQNQNSGTSSYLYSVTFTDSKNGWAVGEDGTILSTDGGKTWQNQNSGTSSYLYSVTFTDSKNGWAVGEDGTILSTTDAGKTWFSQTQPDTLRLTSTEGYGKYPAPWYYLSLLLIGFLFIPVFKKPLPTEETEVDGSIADMLISDRPLDINDPDPLGFKPIALGLSRFIRNVNTQPPLTIAISGQWGSGKSSLMNMLKADLRQNKFQSVWFNAWHHQKEEHLLATLLENIRTHAVPPIWHPKNLVFRYRLLKLRLKRSWPILFLLLAAYSALAGFLWAHPTALGLLSTNLEHILIDLQNGEWPHFDESGTFFGVLVIALGPLSLLAKALRAFGTKPARLMASMSGRFRVRDFTAQAGFRYRFEREFKDVTRALSPHSLVILIDDLDRCKPENVLEVLEAVNFLVSAGDCFVVLGLDLDRVERCVGLGFKDVAEELLDDTDIPELQNNNDSQTIGDAGKRRRGQFARQYLEKLINIEVPVPEPSEAQARNLLVPSANGGIQTESIWRSVGRELTQRTRALVPAIMLTATIIFGFWGGRSLLFEPVQEAQLNQQQSTDETEVTIGQPGILLEPKPEPERDTKISKFESGQTARFPRTLFVAPLLLLLGLGVWRLSILPESIVRDSPEFLQALGVWSPLVYAKQPTPRSVKRFMNRLRYFAMRLPEEESRKSIGMRLKGFLERIRGKNLPETVAVKKELTEATLVALSALHNFNHEWLENEQDWSKIKKGEVVKASNGSPEDLGQMQLLQITLQNAIKNHKSKFKQWPPTDKDIEKLLNLSKGIRVS